MTQIAEIAAEERTTIPILTATDVAENAARSLDEARRRVDDIIAIPIDAVTPENIFEAWDRAAIILEDAFGPISILNSVHPDKGVREAGDEALVQEATFMTELFQNERFYERVSAVEPQSIAQRQLKKDLIESFEDSGVSLAPEKRARFLQISERLTELGKEFSKNIRENPARVRFTQKECEGLPQSWLERQTRDDDGNIVVGFDYPDYVPFMMSARDQAARKRYYTGYTNLGTPRNLEIHDEIVALRKEIADLYGVPSYAHYVTKRRMVENPERVASFLDEVRNVVTEAEMKDLAQLSEMKASLEGIAVERANINRWDASYYRERLRERRYAIDQEALRQYFPTPASVDWMLDISERLYGIRFVEARVPVWHDDVMYLDVYDAAGGEFIGGVYLDLYPRDGKYKHAAAWPVRGVSLKANRKPISVLVTNFNRDGLTHDELETLLHEFGHVLQGVLSSTEYNQHSGTSVDRDFVEAPSQMYEEWANRVESLSLMRAHCATCPVIDEPLARRLRA